MKRKKIIFYLFFAVVAIFFSSCGPSEADLQIEDSLKGYWKPINEETGEACTGVPYYHFGDEAQGSTRYYTYSTTDTMVWEVRRRQLNIYYHESVEGYQVGYNQYNSRSLLHIRSTEGDQIKVSQMFYNGFQSDYILVRITPEAYYAIAGGNSEEEENNRPNNNDNTF